MYNSIVLITQTQTHTSTYCFVSMREVVSETDCRLLMVSCSLTLNSASACDILNKGEECCSDFQ